MHRQRMAIACLLAFQYIACDRDAPTSPAAPTQPAVHPIVGVWQYDGDNFSEAMAARLQTCLIEQEEYAEETAEGLVRITRTLVDQKGMTWPQITFSEDGTFTTSAASPRTLQVSPPGDPRPRSGTWAVSGAQLILFEGGETRTLAFSVSGAQLEFSFAARAFKDGLGFGYSTSGDPTHEFDDAGVTNEACLGPAFSEVEQCVFQYARRNDHG